MWFYFWKKCLGLSQLRTFSCVFSWNRILLFFSPSSGTFSFLFCFFRFVFLNTLHLFLHFCTEWCLWLRGSMCPSRSWSFCNNRKSFIPLVGLLEQSANIKKKFFNQLNNDTSYCLYIYSIDIFNVPVKQVPVLSPAYFFSLCLLNLRPKLAARLVTEEPQSPPSYDVLLLQNLTALALILASPSKKKSLTEPNYTMYCASLKLYYDSQCFPHVWNVLWWKMYFGLLHVTNNN